MQETRKLLTVTFHHKEFCDSEKTNCRVFTSCVSSHHFSHLENKKILAMPASTLSLDRISMIAAFSGIQQMTHCISQTASGRLQNSSILSQTSCHTSA